MGWRYIGARVNGDGTETFLDGELPINDVVLVDQLSGPGHLSGYIAPEIARLRDKGRPIFEPWSTVIYPEADGVIRGGFLLIDLVEEGPRLELVTTGWVGYASEMPYTGEWVKKDIDPATAAAEIWKHLQGFPKGNIGLQVKPFSTPVRIGNETKTSTSTSTSSNTNTSTSVNGNTGQVTTRPTTNTSTSTNTNTTEKPYELVWWKTTDLLKEFNKLAQETPFDYRVLHKWEGERVTHTLEMEYPEIKTRREDLRFVVGENIYSAPQISYDGDQYASEVHVVGAGEGRKAIRGRADRTPSRLRRAVTQIDTASASKREADAVAKRELDQRLGEVDITEIVQLDHPHAPLGAVNVGDDIFIQTSDGWTDALSLWCRVTAVSISPEKGQAVLSVTRTEKALL